MRVTVELKEHFYGKLKTEGSCLNMYRKSECYFIPTGLEKTDTREYKCIQNICL